VEKVHVVNHENRRLTVCEVSEEVGISKSSCHIILTEKLEMHRVAAEFVPRLLTDEQKANRFTVSQELFEHSNADQNFHKNSLRDLRAIPQNTFQDAFQNWKKRWKRCIDSGGKYFEQDKSY
jgi:DNA-binding transcriptional regulator GbsR (MarR family)